jgi:cytochrome c oxidase subunit 2
MIWGNILLAGSRTLAAIIPDGTRSNVFQEIYTVFLLLGTLIGIIVIGYMLQKAYRYRAEADTEAKDIERPELGELPQGSGGGRKLFVSFALSAIVVISLITWTYFTLLYVENPDTTSPEDTMEVEVIGHQFYWEFVYPNGESVLGTLRVPEDTRVVLKVTSADTFHNFGIPELRAKADAIPGETTSTWFIGDEPGTYKAHCYELCGGGHSYMDATIEVLEPDEYETWYAQISNNSTSSTSAQALTGELVGV